MRFRFPAGSLFLVPSVVAAVALVAPVVAPAAAQDWRPEGKAPPSWLPQRAGDTVAAYARYRDALPNWASFGLPALGVFAATIGEVEPNDTTTTATPVALNDTVTGVIDPSADIDFFALDLSAGTVLDLDVDASQFGSALDPVLGLFDVDSVTVLTVNDDFDGLDSRIIYTIPADGRYFVAIVDFGGGGSPQHTYTLRIEEFTTDENEPNDTPAEATAAALHDTLTGSLADPADVDFYAVDFPAPVRLAVRVDASTFAAILRLWDMAGTTVLDSVSAFTTWPVQLGTYLETPGRYYVSVQQEPGAGEGGLYTLVLDTAAVGPGDPTALFATDLYGTLSLAAGRGGELYAITDWGVTVRRIAADGTVSLFLDDVYSSGIAIDGFGDLLVAGWEPSTGRQGIWRVTPAGDRTPFTDTASVAGPLTIGPDGDVWAAHCGAQCPAFIRYDPLGDPKDTIGLGATSMPLYLAFSPSGQLHFTTVEDRVYRLNANGTVTTVITDEFYLEGLAFDEDGYLYVANGFLGTVTLFGPDYQPVEAPFAVTNLGGPIDLAFLRQANGAMTSRLLAANGGFNLGPPYNTAIMEMNPTGMRAPGFRIGVDLLTVITASLPDGVVGAEYTDTLEHDGPAGGTWSVTEGGLPTGLQLTAATGVISGTPTEAGTWTFTVRVDASARLGVRTFSITVAEPSLGVTAAADMLLGVAGALTPELERYLDIQGNNNGQFDIGDLRAFLRAEGQLPALARHGSSAPEKGRDPQ